MASPERSSGSEPPEGNPLTRLGAALCAALREHRSPAHDSLLESLTGDEWAALATLAIRQRVAPLLPLGTLPPMPASVRQTLDARAHASAVQALRFQAECVRLARAVEPLGVQLLVLKGLHLAVSVYPHAGMREMNDFDVMVRPEHVEPVAAAARALGYAPLREMDLALAMQVGYHLPRLVKPGVGLEIHWRLAAVWGPPAAPPEDLWLRAEASGLASNALTLCPEDALLHVCAHATAGHFFEQGLRPLCDLRALGTTYRDRINWEVVATRAREWRCDRGVALALRLAHDLLGVKFPPVIVERLAASRPPADVVSLATDQMLSEQMAPEIGEGAGRLMALRSFPALVRHGWSRVALPPEQLEVIYPGSARSGAVVRALVLSRRLSDLVRRYALRLMRLAITRDSDERKYIDRRNALAQWLLATEPPAGAPPTRPDRSQRSPS